MSATAMPHNQERSRMIREHLNKQEQDAGGADRLPKSKIIVKGRSRLEPIYTINCADLVFNKINGRINAEVLEKEAELGRCLEDVNPDDQSVIKEILLAIRQDENEKVKEDLKKNGQLQPGIVTCDGVVINGNRRKALLEELYADTKDEKYKYIDVQVLPSDITKAELWLIEAGIQLSSPQQLDYSPINHLLKLREGINSGLEIPDMAARIYGVSEEDIKKKLRILSLIDEYLKDFLRKPGKYYLVKNLNEHFIDLCNILDWVEHPRGPGQKDWDPEESDINELKLVGFYYIKANWPHLRIRDLKKIFCVKQSWQEIRSVLEIDPNLTDEDKKKVGVADTVNPTEDDSDVDPAEETISTPVEKQDLQEERVWIKSHEEEMKDVYEDSYEYLQIARNKDIPVKLAERALVNLKGIPDDINKLKENAPKLDEVLREIVALVNELRKTIQKKKR